MNENIIPKVAALHDLSGLGRCSLTVIIPILSSMGIQVCPLPTAVLSTQTGGYDDYTFVDLTDTMRAYVKHWKSVGTEIDCFYSGFVGSVEQIEIMEEFLQLFNMKDKLVVIDPVFADNGKIYSTFTADFVDHMRSFIKHAHIITPNLTEAAFLLKKPLPTGTMTLDSVKEWIVELSDFGPDIIVITSVPLDKDGKSVVAYDRRDRRFWGVNCEYIPEEYPGTGDIFTSVMVGSLLKGDALAVAIDKSCQFVSNALHLTYAYNTPVREGLLIEKLLHTLSIPLSSINYKIL